MVKIRVFEASCPMDLELEFKTFARREDIRMLPETLRFGVSAGPGRTVYAACIMYVEDET